MIPDFLRDPQFIAGAVFGFGFAVLCLVLWLAWDWVRDFCDEQRDRRMWQTARDANLLDFAPDGEEEDRFSPPLGDAPRWQPFNREAQR